MSSPPLVPAISGAIDQGHLMRMALGDAALAGEVLAMFREQARRVLPRIRRRDADMAALVHQIKGSAQGIGAFAVVETAICLEQALREDCDIERALTAFADAVDEAVADIGTIVAGEAVTKPL